MDSNSQGGDKLALSYLLEQKIRGLSENIDYETFMDRWVDFVCTDVPNLNRYEFDAISKMLDEAFAGETLDNEFLQFQHWELIQSLAVLAPEENDSAIAYGPVGLAPFALEQTCTIQANPDAKTVPAEIFDRITDVTTARCLFDHFCKQKSEFLSDYIYWLHNNNVINFDNFALTSRWEMAQKTTPNRNIPSRELVLVSKGPQINGALAEKFPKLQGAIDKVFDKPAFNTARPIIDQIIKQVTLNGSLSRHLALLGPPGIGKTETARILQPILEALEVTGGDFVEYSPMKNPQRYVGYTEKEVEGLLQRLKSRGGGVLLVDEAASLYESDRNPNASYNFRQRAVQIIHGRYKELLDENIVVVFAGYKEGFEKFMSTDPGWARRIQLFDLDPPAIDHLAVHVGKSLRLEDYQVPEKLEANIKWLFTDLVEEDSTEFGYWGTAENFLDMLKANVEFDVFAQDVEHTKSVDFESFKRAAKAIGYRKDVEAKWVGPKQFCEDQLPETMPNDLGQLGWDR